MILAFNPAKIPRTTTRSAWRDIWRWKRETEKRLREHVERQREMLILYGTTHPELARDISERLIYPPVVHYP